MKIHSGPTLGRSLWRVVAPFGVITLGFVFAAGSVAIAQGPPGRDPYNPPPGHGGVPPGQAKKYDRDRRDDRRDDRHDDWRFRGDDRSRFYTHYRNDANRWRGRKRPVFVRGQSIPRNYYVQPVPQTYWQGAPPPPAGYQYGYYGGYVVAYNPTTRIIADVLDLVTAAATR
jgi:Ni/Co efflux regulator RcnB